MPSRLFEQGRFARIPFMAGNDLDEGESVFAVLLEGMLTLDGA